MYCSTTYLSLPVLFLFVMAFVLWACTWIGLKSLVGNKTQLRQISNIQFAKYRNYDSNSR